MFDGGWVFIYNVKLYAYIYIVNEAILASDNGLLPGWRLAIILTNDRILLIGPLGTNFNEILITN